MWLACTATLNSGGFYEFQSQGNSLFAALGLLLALLILRKKRVPYHVTKDDWKHLVMRSILGTVEIFFIYDYSQILFASAVGYLIFGQIADGLSFLGYGNICTCVVAMTTYHRRKEHATL